MRIDKIALDELSEELIWNFILKIRKDGKKHVLTSINLLRLAGAPAASNKWVISEKTRIKKIKKILSNLEKEGKLIERELKQEFLGYREKGYNINPS